MLRQGAWPGGGGQGSSSSHGSSGSGPGNGSRRKPVLSGRPGHRWAAQAVARERGGHGSAAVARDPEMAMAQAGQELRRWQRLRKWEGPKANGDRGKSLNAV